MTTRIGINGFGRIGRSVFRILSDRDDIQVVAVNDLFENEQLAYLLKYDSTHGRLGQDVKASGDSFSVGGQTTKCFSERDPGNLPWKDLGVDYVIESTGLFRGYDDSIVHVEKGGAKRVLISAPTKAPDKVPTLVFKVNHEEFKTEHKH